MIRHAAQLLVVACLTGGTLPAADDPFVGKWRLNVSTSTLTDQMKVQKVGANTYALVFSGTDAETIVADGTDQPGPVETTVSIGVTTPTSWTVTRKKGGHTLLTGMWNLSKDDQTLTDHYKDYPMMGPDVIAATTSSGHRLNERTLDIADKIQGEVFATRQITLSPDRQTLVMTVYPTGHT
jgi:hypothetical protein